MGDLPEGTPDGAEWLPGLQEVQHKMEGWFAFGEVFEHAIEPQDQIKVYLHTTPPPQEPPTSWDYSRIPSHASPPQQDHWDEGTPVVFFVDYDTRTAWSTGQDGHLSVYKVGDPQIEHVEVEPSVSKPVRRVRRNHRELQAGAAGSGEGDRGPGSEGPRAVQ